MDKDTLVRFVCVRIWRSRMFFSRKKREQCRQLDEKLQRIQMNFENNYKDAAQENLREFEMLLGKILEEEHLSPGQADHYKKCLAEYSERMKNFTHKDQKPTWV